MRQYLAFFFLFIFSFQVLPVKAIGKIIAKGQLTEEVKEDCADCDDSDIEKTIDFLHHGPQDFLLAPPVRKLNTPIVHGSDDLPNAHIKDIHCPPPNC